MNTTPVSEHRKYLNEVLMPQWAEQFHTYHNVYDIGKSTTWDYSKYFRCKLRTIDRDDTLKPDVCLDMETDEIGLQADGVIYNGVFEQCDDPWMLLRGIVSMLKSEGKILAGLASIGMEPYGEKDKWRVTIDGAKAYISEYFTITRIVELPEYFYVLGTKL